MKKYLQIFLKSYSEITSISIVNGQYTHTQFSFDIDKSKREYVDYYCGDDIAFDIEHMDANRESYVYRIKNNLPHEKVDIDTIHYNKKVRAKFNYRFVCICC